MRFPPSFWSAPSLGLAVLLVGSGCGDSDRGRSGADSAGGPITVEVAECTDPCPEVILEPVATLGDPEDPALLRINSRAAAAAEYIAVGRVAEEGTLLLYDYDGRLLRQLGRYGAGPGEYQVPVPHPGPDGTVWVVDIGNQRITELDVGGDTTRTLPFTGAIHAVAPLPSGEVLVGGLLLGQGADVEAGMRARNSPPYHFLGPEGNPIRSFGDWRDESLGQLCMTAGADGSLWEGGGPEYVLREWSLEGEVLRVIERSSSMFDAAGQGSALSDRASTCAPRIDTAGALWITVRLPTMRLQDATTGNQVTLEALDRWRDVLIEVIDAEERRVIARGRFDPATLQPLPGSDLWESMRQDTEGYIYKDLWRARIERRR